jgi:hypothetical protein
MRFDTFGVPQPVVKSYPVPGEAILRLEQFVVAHGDGVARAGRSNHQHDLCSWGHGVGVLHIQAGLQAPT